MNPWLWLIWAACTLILAFIAAAVISVVIDKFREGATCPHCGQRITQSQKP